MKNDHVYQTTISDVWNFWNIKKWEKTMNKNKYFWRFYPKQPENIRTVWSICVQNFKYISWECQFKYFKGQKSPPVTECFFYLEFLNFPDALILRDIIRSVMVLGSTSVFLSNNYSITCITPPKLEIFVWPFRPHDPRWPWLEGYILKALMLIY